MGSTVFKVSKHTPCEHIVGAEEAFFLGTHNKKTFFFFLLISNGVILSLLPKTDHPLEKEVLKK